MATTGDYIQIMIDSLKKKLIILDRIIQKNQVQADCINSKSFDEVDWDTFNIAMTEKEAEIERINEMDEGFQSLYDRVGEQIKADKNMYANQIREIQSLITEIESRSIAIRTGEAKNKATLESVLGGRKTEIRQARKSLSAVSSYYQTMQKSFYSGGYSSINKKK